MKVMKLMNLKFTDNSRRNMHRDHLIEVTDVNGDIAYASDLKAAADALGVTKGAISNCCNGKIKRVKGCTMRFVDSITLKPINN